MTITEAADTPPTPPDPAGRPEPRTPPTPQPRAVAPPIGLPDIQIGEPALPTASPARPPRLASLDIFRGITIAAMLLVNNPGSWTQMHAPLRHADWHGWTPTDLIFPFFLFIVGVAIPFSMSKRSIQRDATRGSLLAGIWGRALALVMLGLLIQGTPSTPIDPLPRAGAAPATKPLVTAAPQPTTDSVFAAEPATASAQAATATNFGFLRFLRVATYWVIGFGFLVLLFPWPSRNATVVFAVLIAVLFAALAVSINIANQNALAAGLPANFKFGNGVFDPATMRLPGVLQRIGVCYGVAATIALFAGWRGVLGAAVFLVTVYSVLMLKAPYRDHATGSLTKDDNLQRRIDEDVFRKHNYGAYPDPEGLLSTLPAIANVLLGILVGIGLRNDARPREDKAARLLTWGVFASIAGVLLGWWLMPINKQLWTPSFAVFTCGMGMLGLGAIYYVADVRERRRWALPFTIFGMNAIAAFVIAALIGRLGGLFKVPDGAGGRVGVTTYFKSAVYDGVSFVAGRIESISPNIPNLDTAQNLSLAHAVAFVLVVFIVLSLMYVCRIFLKV